MGKKDKLHQKIRNNPKDVTFDNLKTMLEDFDFVAHENSGGSHVTFSHKDIPELLTISSTQNPIKTPYVKKAIKYIDIVSKIVLENNKWKI